MTLERDLKAAEKAGRKLGREEGAVPCPWVVSEGELCGRGCVPGALFCRAHGGGAAEIVTRAASAVRMEAARALVASELSLGVVQAVGVFLAVLNDPLQKASDRMGAGDRLIALAGGADLLKQGEADEVSSAQQQLRELLLEADDEKLERLAMRLGAVDAEGRVVEAGAEGVEELRETALAVGEAIAGGVDPLAAVTEAVGRGEGGEVPEV